VTACKQAVILSEAKDLQIVLFIVIVLVISDALID